MGERQKLLFVGWDGADWAIARPLIQAGRMPHLAGLQERGNAGSVHARASLLSVPLWTSIATGKRLHAHGVAHCVEPLDDHTDVRPATAFYRTSTPFWELAARAGVRCHVVNWPASVPTQEVSGFFVADRFFRGGDDGAIYPAAMLEDLRALRVAPSKINRAMMRELDLPDDMLGDPGDRRVVNCGAILSEAASVQAVTTAAMQGEAWDAVFVVFSGLERAAHAFMLDRVAGRSRANASAFGGVVDAMYVFHDAMLGRLLKLAGPEANVLLVSDHGVTEDPRLLRAPAATAEAVAALRHRAEGLFVAAGPDVAVPNDSVHVRCVDIAPTALTLLQIPVPGDLAGTVPQGLLSRPKVMSQTTTAKPAQVQRWWQPTDVTHLQSLGYEMPRRMAGERRVVEAQHAAAHAIGRDLLADGQPHAAVDVLQRLVAEVPIVDAYVGALFEAYVGAGWYEDAEALLDQTTIAGRDGPLVHLGRAVIALEQKRPDDALRHLQKARACGAGQLPDLHVFEGEAHRGLGHWRAAEEAFAAALALDATHLRALTGRSTAQLKLQEDEAALTSARAAVRLRPDMADAHDQLGAVLLQLGCHHEAEAALLKATTLEPNHLPGHRTLLRLYEGPLNRPSRARETQQRMAEVKMAHVLQQQMLRL